MVPGKKSKKNPKPEAKKIQKLFYTPNQIDVFAIPSQVPPGWNCLKAINAIAEKWSSDCTR
jgi:hypothetical protein